MKVAILFDQITAEDVIADRDVMQQAACVIPALKALGHEYYLLPCGLNLQAVRDSLLIYKPGVVFNLLDTLDSKDCLSHLPVALVESMGIPHTGASANSIAITTRKLLAKKIMLNAGLPTPEYADRHFSYLHPHGNRKIDWILKGANEDGSFGMTDSSVIRDTQFRDIPILLLERRRETGREFFAEQYIEGREFTVPFLCGKTLPVVEILYNDYPEGKPKILAQAAKWQPQSFEAKNTREEFSDCLSAFQCSQYAHDCMKLFDLRGWGRIDFRVDANNKPYIIDVNANSCLTPDAWWYGSLKHAGIEFNDAIQQILDEAQ